jgi:hypothetical protein
LIEGSDAQDDGEGEAEEEGDVFHDVVCVDGKIGADCRRVREVA